MFDIKVKYRVGGREVSPNEFGSAIEKAVIEEAQKAIIGKLQSVRCRVHNQPPDSVTLVGGTAKRFEVEVHGCCQELIDDALKALQ